MSRQIKFRVWRGDLKRFLSYHELYCLKINPLFSLVWTGQTGHGSDISPEFFQQFTGLLDKHGKEIYEGDLVLNNLPVECPEWGNGGYYLNLNGVGRMPLTKQLINDFQIKIIGNIFENPELLKKS